MRTERCLPAVLLAKLLVGLALTSSLWTFVSAQNISPCIITCVQPIAEQNGCTFQNTTCICGNAKFESEATACLQEKCTAEEQQEAIQLQKRQCGPLAGDPTTPASTATPSGAVSLSTITGSTTSESNASSPTSSTASTTVTSSGAVPAGTGSTGTASAPASTQSNAALPLHLPFWPIIAPLTLKFMLQVY